MTSGTASKGREGGDGGVAGGAFLTDQGFFIRFLTVHHSTRFLEICCGRRPNPAGRPLNSGNQAETLTGSGKTFRR